MPKMTVREMVIKVLKDGGYDGLYYECGFFNCSCGINELAVRCNNSFHRECEPAYKCPYTAYKYLPDKPKAGDAKKKNRKGK